MDLPPSLEPLLRGDPIEAMEVAKAIIGDRIPADPAALEAIVTDAGSRKWSRIAAMYSLGFLGERSAVPVLRRVLSNRKEPAAIRAHAAEALGNIGDTAVVSALAEILHHETAAALRKSCIYALEEIGGPEARAALRAVNPKRQRSKPGTP